MALWGLVIVKRCGLPITTVPACRLGRDVAGEACDERLEPGELGKLRVFA